MGTKRLKIAQLFLSNQGPGRENVWIITLNNVVCLAFRDENKKGNSNKLGFGFYRGVKYVSSLRLLG